MRRRPVPGNIRELQNIIERAVILTTGLNLRDVEREAILEALRKTNGRVSGPGGAAALLGLKRTTLQYRMRLLNIRLSHHPSG
jgi:formate hydrogenlyase transcriptional activator